MDNIWTDIQGEVSQQLNQRSGHWHDLRIGRFTSSQFFKLMSEPKSVEAKKNGDLSEGANTYVLEKVAETLTGTCKHVGGFAIEWGEDNEPICKDRLKKMGYAVKEVGFIPFGDHAGGSPDGEIDDMSLEIKCPFDSTNHIVHMKINVSEDIGQAIKKECQSYYWQMVCNAIFGKKRGSYFVSFDPRMPDEYQVSIGKMLLENVPSEDIDRITAKLGKAIEVKLETLKAIQTSVEVKELETQI